LPRLSSVLIIDSQNDLIIDCCVSCGTASIVTCHESRRRYQWPPLLAEAASFLNSHRSI
jgi:hypothetical protein